MTPKLPGLLWFDDTGLPVVSTRSGAVPLRVWRGRCWSTATMEQWASVPDEWVSLEHGPCSTVPVVRGHGWVCGAPSLALALGLWRGTCPHSHTFDMLDELRAKLVPLGLSWSPSGWVRWPRVPRVDLARKTMYQGPVFCRGPKRAWFTAVDQRAAYLSCAIGLAGRRVRSGLWAWVPRGPWPFGSMPVRIGGRVWFPRRGKFRVWATLSDDAAARLSGNGAAGTLTFLYGDSVVLPPGLSEIRTALDGLPPELQKIAYTRSWGALAAVERLVWTHHDPNKRHAQWDRVSQLWLDRRRLPDRTVLASAIAWEAASKTFALAREYGDDAWVTHIDCVWVRGAARCPDGWSIKYRGVAEHFGPGNYDCLDDLGRVTRSARMSRGEPEEWDLDPDVWGADGAALHPLQELEHALYR